RLSNSWNTVSNVCC
ncbi:ABC transporter family protein, partial [Vibrio parahaemolyticus V-223/04]